MDQIELKFPDLAGEPSLKVNIEDGTVTGFDQVLPLSLERQARIQSPERPRDVHSK